MGPFSSVTVAWLLPVQLCDFSGWWGSGLSSSSFSPSPGCTPSLPPSLQSALGLKHTQQVLTEKKPPHSLNFLFWKGLFSGLLDLTTLFSSALFGYCWGHFTLPCCRLPHSCRWGRSTELWGGWKARPPGCGLGWARLYREERFSLDYCNFERNHLIALLTLSNLGSFFGGS